MRMLVVIVNYATPDLTVDCLRSLEAEVAALEGVHVAVTDNLSPDDSVKVIGDAIDANGWSSWVTFTPLDRNGGFAWGNNQAIRPALESDDPPDYILLLNPDTYIHPDALRALIDFMDAHPKAGIAGSRIENPDGSARRTAFGFHSVIGEFSQTIRLGIVQRLLKRWQIAPEPKAEDHKTDWVSGASMAVRREVFDDIGLLDDDYFMYYEEMDFCLRAHRAGWECWYVVASRVVHLVGQASGVTGEQRKRKRTPKYWFESREHFFKKMHGGFYKFLADVAWVAGSSISRLRDAVLRRPNENAPHLLADFIRFNFLHRPRP